MIELFDTHCHLDVNEFAKDREEVVARARAAGVKHWINLSLNFRNIPLALELAEKYPECYAAVGIYPRYCADWKVGDIERIRKAADHPKVVALGEIGLDYQFNIKASKEIQFKVLTMQLALAAELDLPVLLHNRDLLTYQDTLKLVAESPLAGRQRPGLLHCFQSEYEIAKRALDMGLYLSFAGPVTYAGARKLPELVAKLPLDRIVIETDSPCVPPEPYRKVTHRSEPAHVLEVAKAIAAIHHKSMEEIAKITTRNACILFGI